EQYIAKSAGGTRSSFKRGDWVRVATDRLNLRSSASGYAAVVAQLTEGSEAAVVGGPRSADGYVWIQVQSDRGSGWAAQQYLRKTSARATSGGRFRHGQSVVVDTDNLNLRNRAGTGGTILLTLARGTVGEVLDGPRIANGFTWYRLSTDEGNGWVVENYLSAGRTTTTSGSLRVGDRAMVNTDLLNIRRAAGTNNRVVAVLYWGKSGAIVDGPRRADGTDWYRIKTNKGTGWCSGRYLLKVTSAGAVSGASSGNRVGDVVAVDVDSLRLRAAPRMNARVMATLPNQRKGTVVGGPRSADGYDWLQIATSEGTGWCVAYFLRRISRGGQPIGTRVRVIDGELNLRTGPSTQRGVSAILPEGAVVEVLEGERRADGHVWWKVSSSRYGTGWVVSAYLAAT
ncbi:MAG: SH3 domain-containing protein, partial [Chloroflexota bacterium]|nr:SH3 domain-containing protein [Chloroflexota bacterium]